MLIQFSVSNFLSFNEKETFSMIAGKTRKNIDRVFSNKKVKLTKCEVILGANASGKSNLVSAFQFAQSVIVDGLPRGFSNKFFRLNPENKTVPSEFESSFFAVQRFLYMDFLLFFRQEVFWKNIYMRR